MAYAVSSYVPTKLPEHQDSWDSDGLFLFLGLRDPGPPRTARKQCPHDCTSCATRAGRERADGSGAPLRIALHKSGPKRRRLSVRRQRRRSDRAVLHDVHDRARPGTMASGQSARYFVRGQVELAAQPRPSVNTIGHRRAPITPIRSAVSAQRSRSRSRSRGGKPCSGACPRTDMACRRAEPNRQGARGTQRRSTVPVSDTTRATNAALLVPRGTLGPLLIAASTATSVARSVRQAARR